MAASVQLEQKLRKIAVQSERCVEVFRRYQSESDESRRAELFNQWVETRREMDALQRATA